MEPKSWKVKVFYESRLLPETFDVNNQFVDPCNMFCFDTVEGLRRWIPLSSIRKVELDKNYTTILKLISKEKKKSK